MASRPGQEWATRSERGALPLIRLIVWIALSLGRPIARLFLYPICAYYVAFAGAPRRASRLYLTRVLARRPGIGDVFRHFHCFASCALDRVFLLNGQTELFDIHVHGEEIVLEILRRDSGCILLGAHFGSFEVARAMGRRQPNLRVTLVMYEENARKIRTALAAINPQLAMEVIGLGTFDSMIAVGERLDQGHFIGILADRSVDGEDQVRYPFLGSSAAFPCGAFRMAVLLQRPVVLMFGVYRGGRRYDLFFETLIDPAGVVPTVGRGEQIQAAMRQYVERVEHYCRDAPYNWFNFYNFWA
jgi:predicted LPLAT superfamily acyltransferase